MLTKAYGGWIWRVSEFTNLYLEEIFAKFLCRKQLSLAPPLCLPLVLFCVFAVSRCSIVVEDSCSHEESLSRTVLRKNPVVEAQQDDISPKLLTSTPSSYANFQTWTWKYNEIISKTKGRHRASCASYCFEKVDDKGRRAIRHKNTRGGMKGNGARNIE